MSRRLPRSLEDVRGLRAARWIRESTAGQADNFGPDAQRELQDRAIERWSLVDADVEYSAAHSGRTIATTSTWADMLAGAGETWDVLVVGYVSRFARDLRTAVNARHDLHARGAVILFADERVLSSDEDEWERWAREAVEAEAYSRRLGKRIREGYAAKRRRLGVPGGNRAPLGTIRRGRELELDSQNLRVVHQAYELAASGATDRDVAAATGLKLKHVAEVLTSRFYRGELTDGTPSALGALVDIDTWELVQSLRARYSRRHRGAVSRRQYPLSGLLVCSGCSRRLIGHSGRYRHVDACEAFRAAAPRRRRAHSRNYDGRIRGESYGQAVYDEAIAIALGHAGANGRLVADTVAIATRDEGAAAGDVLALARISREREQAALRFAGDRDMPRLEATLARLDAQEADAHERPSPTPTAAQARAYVESLPDLWAATSDAGRHAIAEALFERVDVLGTALTLHPTPAAIAHGWDRAFGDAALVCSIGQSGRGERLSAATTDVTMRLAQPPTPIGIRRTA